MAYMRHLTENEIISIKAQSIGLSVKEFKKRATIMKDRNTVLKSRSEEVEKYLKDVSTATREVIEELAIKYRAEDNEYRQKMNCKELFSEEDELPTNLIELLKKHVEHNGYTMCCDDECSKCPISVSRCEVCDETAELVLINDRTVLPLCDRCYAEVEKRIGEINCEHELIALINELHEDIESGERLGELEKTLKHTTPESIKKYLDERVIGQERAKKVLSVALYNHYMRIVNKDTNIQKSNILMVGPSGVGKTKLAESLAELVNVPFVICDATTVTEAGYVGDDVENMLLRLYQAADEDLGATEMGIIYVDEIDKIARKGESTSITRDVSGEGVQQTLLKIIEGADVDVPVSGGRKHPNGERIRINTRNILFICGGAFEGLTMNNKKEAVLGFNKVVEEQKRTKIGPEDIKKQGMIPELVGRLPIIAELQALTVDDLKRILVEPVNNICDQYKRLLGLSNVELEFSEEAIEFIAKKALDSGSGARGLRGIIEDNMIDIMYEVPTDKSIERVVVVANDKELEFKKIRRMKKVV